MATTTVTPAAPAAAAPSVPAPAAAPSTPAPVSTPVSTPGPLDSPSAAVETKLGEAWKTAKASLPLEETVEAPAETTPPAEETTTPPGEVTTEATPEEKVEAAVAEPEKAAETPAEPTQELDLDDGEAATPKEFADFLNKNAEAKKALDADPGLKNKVMGALRRDTENREIRQLIPDVETAKTVTQAAATYQGFDNKFLAAVDPQKADAWVDHLFNEAVMIGADGKPILENGQYKFHEALPNVIHAMYQRKQDYLLRNMKETGKVSEPLTNALHGVLEVLGNQAKVSGDERLQAAVDILRDATPLSSPATENIPDELKPRFDSLKAKEAEFAKRESDAARQRQESEQAAHTQSIEKAETKAAESVRSQLKPAFAKAGLTDFESEAALTKIGNVIDEKLSANALYQSIYDSILLDPPSEAREKRLTKHMLTYANQYLGSVTAEVLRSAKGGAVARQAEKQAKVDTQKAASKTEPQGVSVTTSSNSPTPTSNAAIIEDYKKSHGGEAPDMNYVLGEALKRAGGVKGRG